MNGAEAMIRTLVDAGRTDTVRDVRSTFQSSMEQTFRSEIERLTGRGVQSFMSQVDPVGELAVQVYLLDPADGGELPD